MTPRTDSPARQLKAFIAENSDDLERTLRIYALRAGLAQAATADQVGRELLSEVVVEALEHADRFDTSRHPRSWLLGIGANMIRRRTSSRAKREKREPLVLDMYGRAQTGMSEDEVFEQVTQLAREDESDLESREAISMLMGNLSNEDQEIIKLAVLHELDGTRLAKALGVKPGTARMRLHRALRRLRAAHNVVDDD